MITSRKSQIIDQQRRSILSNAAKGIALAGVASLSLFPPVTQSRALKSDLSASIFRKKLFSISAGASTPRDGPTGRR